MATTLLRHYVALLQRAPFTTNAVSATGVAVSGDALAQTIEHKSDDDSSFDTQRTLKLALWGFFWMGPSSTLWYRFLDARLGPGRIAAKVALNQVTMAPFVNALFYFYTEVWRNRPSLWRRYERRMREEYVPTMVTSVVYWVPAQSVNFGLVALLHRPLFLNVAFVLWTAHISYRGHKVYHHHPTTTHDAAD